MKNIIKQDFLEKNYQMLNKAQKEIVEQIYWQIMVVAGPWTGKTQIIALRTANIILKTGINPENILITTFTEAWVIAIKKRLVSFIWTEAYKVKVSTIHSFSQDIITSFPEKFAEYKALNNISDIETLEVLTDIIDENIKNNNIEYLFSPYDRYMYLRDIKDRIWKLKAEWINMKKFEKIIFDLRKNYDEKLEELKSNKRIRDLEKRTKKDSEIYNKHIKKLEELNYIYWLYQEFLNKNSLYDFSDMINFVVDKFKKDEDLKYLIAEKYQFLMLDEYQDTNNPQNEIMNLILSVSDEKNIMVVWDDDQSIYRFQGANIENMLDFSNTYPDTKFIVLENNYRSSQSILDLSMNLIENNSQRLINKLDFLDKKLIAQSIYKNLNKNKYYILQDEQLEKLFVLEEMKKKNPPIPSPFPPREKGNLEKKALSLEFSLPDGEKEAAKQNEETFAIICRSNKEVESWTKFMQLEWIEVESKLKTNILKNKFVNFILNFLSIIENPNSSDEKLLDILRTEIIDVENIDVITLARELYKKNYSKSWFKYSLWELVKRELSSYSNPHPNPLLWEERGQEQKNSHLPQGRGAGGEGFQAILELEQEEKYKSFEKIIDFRDLILELNSNLGLYWISRLFQKLLDKIWLVEYIEVHWNFSDLEDVFSLFNKIKSFNERNSELTLKELLNKFDLHHKYNIAIPRQILKKTKSNIEILTAHSSKWLEYDYVYIPWVFAWNWEGKRIVDKLKLPLHIVWEWLQFAWLSEKELKDIEKETQTQEDRRLFFVAMTRAKKELIFTRPAWKENKPYIDSSFILETGLTSTVLENSFSENEIKKSIKNTLLSNEQNLIKVSKDEINYISEFLETYKLSPTDLNTFLEDPKQFLRNVIFKYPFNGNEFTIFGNVYHKVLEIFTNAKIRGEKIELWMITEKFLELLNYQILTSEEKERLTKKWIEWLTWYFEHFTKNPRTPLVVEYNFRSRDVVFEGVRITGKVDKVEKVWDSLTSPLSWILSPHSGEKEATQSALFVEDVAVVDYKTWAIKTQGKIKWVDRYWNKKDNFEEGKYYRQLLFYKLLAENDREFNSKFNVVELALDFVEWKNWEYKYVAISPEQDDYEEFKKLVKDSWGKINSLEFWEEVLG